MSDEIIIQELGKEQDNLRETLSHTWGGQRDEIVDSIVELQSGVNTLRNFLNRYAAEVDVRFEILETEKDADAKGDEADDESIEYWINLEHPCYGADVWALDKNAPEYSDCVDTAKGQGYLPLDMARALVYKWTDKFKTAGEAFEAWRAALNSAVSRHDSDQRHADLWLELGRTLARVEALEMEK